MTLPNSDVETTDELNARYAAALLPLTVIFAIFTVVGVLGNAGVIVVFSLGRASRNSTFRVFAIFLAIVDLMACAFLLPSEIAKHRNFFHFENLALCQLKVFINTWLNTAACLGLLVISVDRYRKVCRPLAVQMTQRQVIRLCVAFIFLLPGLVSAPGLLISDVRTLNKTNVYGTNTTIVICWSRQGLEYAVLTLIFQVTTVLMLLVVCISTSVLYTLIGCDLYRHWGTYPVAIPPDGKRHHSDCSIQTLPYALDRRTTHRTRRRGTQIISAKAAKEALQNTSEQQEADRKESSCPAPLPVGGSSLINHRNIRRKTRVKRFPNKTIIWFILTVVFIVTHITSLVLAFVYTPDYLLTLEPNTYVVILCFQKITYINHIINPMVYFILDRHFRHVCRNIVPRLKVRFAECGT